MNTLASLVCLALTASLPQATQEERVPPSPQAAQQQQPQQPTPPGPTVDRVVLKLEDLVTSALQLNLGLLVSSVDNRIQAIDVDAEGSIFNPDLVVGPFAYTIGKGEATLSTGTSPPGEGLLSGRQSGPDAAATLSGLLPFSTRYSADFQTSGPNLAGYPFWGTSLIATLTQPLLRGAGKAITRSGITLAELSADASQERLSRLAESTIADVENAYWNLGLAEELEKVAGDSLLRAQDLLDRNEQLLALELVAETDTITARRGVAARETTLTDAIRLREDRTDQLIFIVFGEQAWARLQALGVGIGTEPPPNEAPTIPAIEQLEASARTERHDLLAAGFDIDRSELAYTVAQDDTRPDLSLVASYTASTSDTDTFRLFSVGQIGDSRFSGVKAGVQLTYPLGNDLAVARRTQAQLDVDRSQLVRTAVENGIVVEVREAVRATRSNVEKLEQASRAHDLATQQYDNGVQQLQLGLIDSFRLLQFDEERLDAAVIELQARYALAAAITRYELAIGSIDDKYDPGLSERYRE